MGRYSNKKSTSPPAQALRGPGMSTRSGRLISNTTGTGDNINNTTSQTASPKMKQPKITDTVRNQKNRKNGKPLSKIQARSKQASQIVMPIAEEATESKSMRLDKAKFNEELKQFDLNSTYGPCCGISRLERLNRAITYQLGNDLKGLNKMRENLLVFMKEDEKIEDDKKIEQCIWDHRTLYVEVS